MAPAFQSDMTAVVPPSPCASGIRRLNGYVPTYSSMSEASHSRARQEETLWLRTDNSSNVPSNAFLCDLHGGLWSLFAHQELVNVPERPQHRRHSSVPPKDISHTHFRHGSAHPNEFDIAGWTQIEGQGLADGSSSSFPDVPTCQTTPLQNSTHGISARDNRSATENQSCLSLAASSRSHRAEKRRHKDDTSGEDNKNATPKRRRVAALNGAHEERKFPCICHVGEPARYPNDVARHKHISEMCRHLKSHSFYICSTCVTQFANEDELEMHQHIRICRMKGCKRQRWAFEPEPGRCDHLLTAEEQWRAVFRLKYNREPPNLFEPSPEEPAVQFVNVNGQDFGDVADPGFGLQSVTDTFANLDTVEMVEQPSKAGPDFDAVLGVEPLEFIPNSADTSTYAMSSATTYQMPSLESIVEDLQNQVTALERALETQKTEDRGTIFTFQMQVSQLEQKLFQSSEREEQLEATLGVVFDAFQASGVPQAQPGGPLSKLVRSHSSRAVNAISSLEGSHWQSGAHGTIPALALETAQFMRGLGNDKTVGGRTARSDSGYGSAQF